MGGSGKPEQKSDQIDWTKAEFHFAVRTREGKQVKVAIIPWPRPVSGSGAPAPVEILKNPKWADAQAGKGARYAHGEEAEMSVEAPGHDGKRVKFIVEHRNEGQWSVFQTVHGVVQGGVARAKIVAEHPTIGAKGGALLPAVLRFRKGSIL